MSIIPLLYEMKLSLTLPFIPLLLSYLLKHTSSFNVAIKSTFSCFYNVFWNLSQFVVCTAVEKTQQRIYEYVVLKLKQMSLLISTEPLWAILKPKGTKNTVIGISVSEVALLIRKIIKIGKKYQILRAKKCMYFHSNHCVYCFVCYTECLKLE